MLSEKLTRILLSKSAFSPETIAQMTEREGWQWVYTNKTKKEDKPQICFTGFNAVEVEELHVLARTSGWIEVVGSVTKKLEFLCMGPNAGPVKLEKAKKQGATVLTREQFEHLMQTGEIPVMRSDTLDP